MLIHRENWVCLRCIFIQILSESDADIDIKIKKRRRTFKKKKDDDIISEELQSISGVVEGCKSIPSEGLSLHNSKYETA